MILKSGLFFLRFLNVTSKNVKSRIFWIFKKNIKTYSRTMLIKMTSNTTAIHVELGQDDSQ